MSDRPHALQMSGDDPPGVPRAGNLPTHAVGVTLVTVVAPVLVYFVAPFDGDLGAVVATGLVIAAAALLVPLSIHQAGRVLRSDYPLFDAVRCIVTGLTLLIVAFSSAYYVLATHYDDQIAGIHTKLDAMYFSGTIMSTVGFGDITATGQVGRGVVLAHFIVSFALVAVAVRVVTWALRERHGGSMALAMERRAEGPVMPSPPSDPAP